MNWFQHLTRRAPQKSSTLRRRRPRLCLEALENRLVPASVFVVPVSQMSDGTHWHQLAQAIVAAGANGEVTVEPGASPDFSEPIAVGTSGITIQGDPNTPASILPQYQLVVEAHNVTLTNLNLPSITIGSTSNIATTNASYSNNTISKCIIATLTDFGTTTTITQNTITDSATLTEDGNLTPPGDVIANNTFSSTDSALLEVESGFGAQITGNTFFGDSTVAAIVLDNCQGFPNDLTQVANNTISLTNKVSGVVQEGIDVQQFGISGISDVLINNNSIKTQDVGIQMTIAVDSSFTASVQGNDFHGNPVGVGITCDGTTGISSVASINLNGNDFRSFTTTPASASAAAIVLMHAPTTTVVAEQNLFSVTPSTVVFKDAASLPIDTSNSLSNDAAFVQSLYNLDLGRTGTTAELNGWISVLHSQSQQAVVSGIYRSAESLGHIVDSFYLRFLGRASDPSGRAGWITFLQSGGTEEQMENLFLTSPEYLGHINTDFVQSLYINILERTGASNELAGWNNNLQALGLAGIANGFTSSTENRDNAITADYETYLNRLPTAGELKGLATSTEDMLSIAVTVQSTSEFYSNG